MLKKNILFCLWCSLMKHNCIIGVIYMTALAEFRFFWLNYIIISQKLVSAGDPPSTYHRYKFSLAPIYMNMNALQGLQAAYLGRSTPYVKDKDGLLF